MTIVRIRTPGNATLNTYRIQPERDPAHCLRYRLINVHRQPARSIRPKLRLPIHKRIGCRNLARLIDHPTGSAAPKLHTRWSLQHLYLLKVEAVAVVAPEVAN